MPRYESTVAVPMCLGIGVAEWGLGTEIHITEEELANQVCWWSGFVGFGIGLEDVHYAPIEEADTEGTEVVVGREESSGLRREGCGSSLRLGEGCCVCCVRDYFIEGAECDVLATAVLCSGRLEAKLGHYGYGEVTVGTGEFGVGFVILIALYFVDVWGRRRLCLLKVEGSVARVWERFWS